MEEPRKVVHTILATALEVDLWGGRSTKSLLSSKSFPVFSFLYIYPTHFHCKLSN